MKDALVYVPILGLVLQFVIAPIAYKLYSALKNVLTGIETQKHTLDKFMVEVRNALRDVRSEQHRSAERHIKTEHSIEQIMKDMNEIKQEVYKLDGRIIALEKRP